MRIALRAGPGRIRELTPTIESPRTYRSGSGREAQVGFDHRITGFELASDLEGAKRASYVVGAAAAIGEGKAGVGRWNSSRQRHLEVRVSAIAAPASDLGISKAKAHLRILGVVADDGLQVSKERITPHFPYVTSARRDAIWMRSFGSARVDPVACPGAPPK